MEAAPAQRKYALVKVGTGDYLLPSNDGHTLWRLHTYTDGPSFGLDWPNDRMMWALSRWHRALDPEALELSPPNPDNWDEWERVEDWFDTRREAIGAALASASSAT